jgi:hypothetical protein
MRRFLALVLLVAAATVNGSPAAAKSISCKVIEQVYGISHTGDLIVQAFCETPGAAYLPPRTLASFGAQVPQLFYGGQLPDHTVIIYGVGSDGALRWYRENPWTGRLGPGVVIGSQFGDWRRYQHLQSAGNGDLSGVDAAGRMWRWAHLGWEDGADTWAVEAPEDLGKECVGARPVFAGRDGPERYAGVEGSSYVYCRHDGTARTASLLPVGVEAATMAVGPGVTYALRQSDHRLTRLVLDVTTSPPRWHTDAVAQAFSAIFTGMSIRAAGGPVFRYEWQWVWYEENA